MQGYAEQSNVSVVDEFINLITAQRAYEANSKVVKAADEMYQQVNNLTKSENLMTHSLFFLLAVSSPVFAACLPVAGSRILGRDLALADPRFAALPATLAVGFAPEPGVRRIYSAAELQRLARANGLQLADPPEICFELPMRSLSAADAAAAMPAQLFRRLDPTPAHRFPGAHARRPMVRDGRQLAARPPRRCRGLRRAGLHPRAGALKWSRSMHSVSTLSTSPPARPTCRHCRVGLRMPWSGPA